MKKIYNLLIVLCLAFFANAQNSWDTIMTGIQFSSNKFPGCYNITKVGGSLYGSTSTGLYKSSNNGDTWEKKNNGSLLFYSPRSVYEVSNGRLLALGGFKYAVVKSDDNGNTWDTTMAFPNASYGQDLIMASDGKLYAAVWDNQNKNTNGIYISTDNGNTWAVKYAFTQSNQRVWTLYRVTDSIFIAGTNYGIFRTEDAGTTWNGVGLNGSLNQVVRIIKHPNGTLYAATSGKGIQKSTDNGQSWTASSMVSATSSATYYDVDADKDGNIYLSQYGVGILKFNASETAMGIDSAGLFNKRIRDLFIDESGSSPVFFVSCEGATAGNDLNGYFFRKGLSTPSNVNEIFAAELKLFPNPVSSILNIESNEEIQSIQVADIAGRIVIAQNNLATRNSQLATVELPSGTYFIHIKTATGKTAVKSFVKQ